MRFRPMHTLHRIVKRSTVKNGGTTAPVSTELLCRAMDYACVLYFKQVLCLQRSSATTLLLRRYGWDAEMVIGAQVRPFRSHAWVEVGEAIVGDKPYLLDIYQVLERC
jgi:hypothetical protein